MENRDYLFDNAKGLMIFAVVLGHVLEYDLTGIARALYIVIYSVHMPLFVLISGYFAQFNAEKIVKKLIVPYLSIQLVYTFFCEYVRHGRKKCEAVLIGCTVLLFVISPLVDYRWLYGSYSYSQIGYGAVYRLAGYFFGVTMSLCILKLMSRKKSFVSKIGRKSMYVYLGHAPGVLLFNKLCEKIYPLQLQQLLWVWLALILQKLIYVRNL